MKIICVICSMALLVTTVLADLTVVQTLESSAMPVESGKRSTMTIKMRGQKARIDFSGMPVASIIDLNSRQLCFMDHKQKQVMVMPQDLARNILGLSIPAAGAVPDKAILKKTGKVEMLNGYTCEEYAGSSGGVLIRCWVAHPVEAVELEPFRLFAEDVFKETSFAGLVAIKGLIVRSESTVVTSAKTVTSRTELLSVSKTPLAEAVFNLPGDYTIMDMPAFPVP